MIRDYLGQSEIVHGIELFPISILDWVEFEQVAPRLLCYGYDFIKYRIKPDKEDVRPFDLLMAVVADEILKTGNTKCQTVLDMEKMFSMVTKKEVKLDTENVSDGFKFVVEDRFITRDNFDDIRQVVMRQNLIFEPLIVEDAYTQKIIDRAIKTKNRTGGEFDFGAMIIYVCNRRNLTPEQISKYTYYQLRCDNEMIQRMEYNDSVHHYRSQGAKADSMNVYKHMETLTNPYSWDKFFTKVDASSDSKMERLMKG